MQLNSVVLPAPLGPISPHIWPRPTSKLGPSRATTPPKRTTTSLISKALRALLPQGRLSHVSYALAPQDRHPLSLADPHPRGLRHRPAPHLARAARDDHVGHEPVGPRLDLRRQLPAVGVAAALGRGDRLPLAGHRLAAAHQPQHH